jgi:hypothetical protein
VTLSHLAKTGRAPVSQEQALAICCEVGATNYVETSAVNQVKDTSNAEAIEMCAIAAMRSTNSNNGNTNNFRGATFTTLH